MDRLKREWQETQIPEEIRLRARNLAWSRLNRPVRGRRALAWTAVATTVAAVVFLTWIWSGSETRVEQAAIPTPQNILRTPAIAANQITRPSVEAPQAAKLKPAKRSIAPKRERAPAEEPERIVLNFTLPESGARMIWIMDSRFHLEGDNQ
jgi:hypothetical protein